MTPEERLKASRDPERWEHAPLRPRDNPFGQRYSPRTRTVFRSVLAVAVVAAVGAVLVVGAVLGRGADNVSPPAGPAPSSSPTQIPDPTPDPTVAPTEDPIVEPPASEATCTNLLDAKRVTKFENAGWGPSDDEYRQKVIDEGDGKGLSKFADGIICRWGVMNGDQSIMFGYAAISDEDAEVQRAKVISGGGELIDDNYEHYNGSGGAEYAFGDGFWLYYYDNAGEPNLMNMLYRNAAKL